MSSKVLLPNDVGLSNHVVSDLFVVENGVNSKENFTG